MKIIKLKSKVKSKNKIQKNLEIKKIKTSKINLILN